MALCYACDHDGETATARAIGTLPERDLCVDEGTCWERIRAEARSRKGWDAPGPTLTDALAAHGVTHRAAPEGRQGRMLVDCDGKDIGVMTAGEAWAWLRSGRVPARLEAEAGR